MPDIPPASTAAAPEPNRAKSLLAALASYLEARGLLFQIEAREAGTGFSRVASAMFIGAVLMLIGWMAALPAVVSLTCHYAGFRWEFVTLAVAGFHVLLGLLFLIIAKARRSRLKPFEETLHQFSEDRAWLAQNPQQK
jgi:uncharacterized membrane protein YqjE